MIGIFSNNRPEWSIADYGILGIRGVTVPFFGTATKEQVKYIVDETAMKLIFTGNKEQFEKAYWLFENTKSLETIVYFGPDKLTEDDRCIRWEDFLATASGNEFQEKLEVLQEEAGPNDLATLLYTSGTTGEPKGVMLTHDNFMSCFEIHKERLDVNQNDVSMCFLPLSHVFERTWSYYMMYCGVENVFLENPREVINELPVVNPTVMCVVPRFFEKTYEGIQNEFNIWPAYKKRIFNWSIKTGQAISEYKARNERIPFFLSLKRSIADRLVLKKLRNIFGTKMRTMPCSGAAISEDLLRFFHATGLFVNYGYGATETTATVSCFRTDSYNFETCGTVMPEVEVKISEAGEIQVRGRTVFKGYYKKPEQTSEVLNNGWYSTGDEGYLVDENQLVMTDRMRDLFKTSVGKYVSPQKLELLIGQNRFVEQVITFGDNQKFITALIVPSFENLALEMKKLGVQTSDPRQLIQEPNVLNLFEKELEKAQTTLAPFERIARFTLLAEPFSIENNGLTSTLKVRRKVIRDQHRTAIEQMYSGG
jgi:long-chain acyl-CoA synthetase